MSDAGFHQATEQETADSGGKHMFYWVGGGVRDITSPSFSYITSVYIVVFIMIIINLLFNSTLVKTLCVLIVIGKKTLNCNSCNPYIIYISIQCYLMMF